MSLTDRSYAVRTKLKAAAINAAFQANNPTRPQENSQPGAVEQSYKIGRMFGQINLVQDGVVSPACGCVETGGGPIDYTETFTSCSQGRVFTLNEGDTLTVTNSLGSPLLGIYNGTSLQTITFNATFTTSTPGTYTVACPLIFTKNTSGPALANTIYIIQNNDSVQHTFSFTPTDPSPTVVPQSGPGNIIVRTSLGDTTGYTVS